MYSYHIFMFPFQWEKNNQKGKPFGDRFHLDEIKPDKHSKWENISEPVNTIYQNELYNEKNFFYKFVHKALYDDGKTGNSLVRHFERKEAYTSELTYEIGVKANHQNTYTLQLKSVCLDIYATGTGIITFYLVNNKYDKLIDVKRINQFGRRLYPPFFGLENGLDETKSLELADYISINGLSGDSNRYYEDFTSYSYKDTWTSSKITKTLIQDLNRDLVIEPVVDDRMFTMCWYLNNVRAHRIKEEKTFNFSNSNEWHEYLYIDSGDSTCQNLKMQEELLNTHTYPRWQKYGTLYGVTRHSFMAISDEGEWTERVLVGYFRTHYARMVALVLMQRASILKFSDEVTRLSNLSGKQPEKLAKELDNFYKAYIQFVNQVYFREITAQDQGIELYKLLHDSLGIKDQVKDLDDEISELHNYATLLDEKAQSNNLSLLTVLGSLFLVPSFIVGFFGMNLLPKNLENSQTHLTIVILIVVLIAVGLLGVIWLNKREKKKMAYLLISAIGLLAFLTMVFTLITIK